MNCLVKKSIIVLFLCCALFSVGAYDSGLQDFTFDFYHHASGDNNFLFSPVSISQAFAMIYAGAENRTADQLADVFHFQPEKLDQMSADTNLIEGLEAVKSRALVDLTLCNAIWPDIMYPIRESFIDTLGNRYKAEIFPVNYEDPEKITKMINTYVEDNTNGKIKKILDTPLNSNSRFTLINVIYLDADWKYQFKKKETSEMDFHPALGEDPFPVQMMHQTEYYNYYENEQVQILELPYADEQLSMVILLPEPELPMNDFEQEFSYSTYLEWLDQMEGRSIELHLPRFDFSFEIDLQKELRSMGVTDAFSAIHADFASMVEPVDVNPYIDFAKHQAVITVDEMGTEAAAVTVGGGCFPAGTLVRTPQGTIPIETITKGDKILSYDLEKLEWTSSSVQAVLELSAKNEIVTITAGSETFKATGNHPIYVVDGKALASRKRPEDIPAVELYSSPAGTWVEARDLQVGDTLLSRAGEVCISNISNASAKLETVYNLSISENHNYAVTSLGILVHNKASAEENPQVFLADHPFIFLIRDKSTNTIYFMGKVINPVLKKKSFWEKLTDLFS